MNDSTSYSDVTSLILRRWSIVVGVTVLAMAVGYVFSTTLPERYSATATVLTVQEPEGVEVPDADRTQKEQLALTFADIGRRPAVLEPAAEELGMGDAWRTLRSAVTIRLVPRTLLLEIETTASSPELAERRADAVAKWLIEVAADLSPFIQVQTDPGLANRTPIAPNPSMNAIIAGGLGFLGSTALLLAGEAVQRRRTARLAAVAPVAGRIPRGLAVPRNLASSVVNAVPAAAEWLDAVTPVFLHVRSAERSGAGGNVAVLSFTGVAIRPVISTSLAAALALDGAEVGLVDLDFRRPSLHSVCGSLSAPGVSEMMKSRNARAAFATTALPGLKVLPNGQKAVPNAALLAPRAIERTIARSEEERLLVFDAPVNRTLAEFALIGEKVGIVLLVVDEATLGGADLGFLSSLGTAGINVSGLVVVEGPGAVGRFLGRVRSALSGQQPEQTNIGNDRALAVIENGEDDEGVVGEISVEEPIEHPVSTEARYDRRTPAPRNRPSRSRQVPPTKRPTTGS